MMNRELVSFSRQEAPLRSAPSGCLDPSPTFPRFLISSSIMRGLNAHVFTLSVALGATEKESSV
jgi:hypothetical protein